MNWVYRHEPALALFGWVGVEVVASMAPVEQPRNVTTGQMLANAAMFVVWILAGVLIVGLLQKQALEDRLDKLLRKVMKKTKRDVLDLPAPGGRHVTIYDQMLGLYLVVTTEDGSQETRSLDIEQQRRHTVAFVEKPDPKGGGQWIKRRLDVKDEMRFIIRTLEAHLASRNKEVPTP